MICLYKYRTKFARKLQIMGFKFPLKFQLGALLLVIKVIFSKSTSLGPKNKTSGGTPPLRPPPQMVIVDGNSKYVKAEILCLLGGSWSELNLRRRKNRLLYGQTSSLFVVADQSAVAGEIEIGQLLLKVNKRSVASGQVRLEAEMKLSANDASAAIVLTRWREQLMSGCR